MNYGEIFKNENNQAYIEEFFLKLCTHKISEDVLLRLFTVKELKELLFDDVLGKYFIMYFKRIPSCFIDIFCEKSLEVAYELNNEDILKYCFQHFISQHDIIVEFLKHHPDTSRYLLNRENLFNFLNQNRLQNKPFLENIPSEFIYKNIDAISHVIFLRFPNDITRFLDELASYPFFLEEMEKNHLFLEKIISRCRCGEGRYLISFLNKYQKQYPIDLEMYRKEILEVLFSHDSMNDKKENSYLEVLEMVLDEVLQAQELTMNDIKYLKAGCYSAVYQIGDFLLKVGNKRHCLKIPSHRNLLRPIFRKYLSDIHLMVEIAPKVFLLGEQDSKACQTLFNSFYKDKVIFIDIQPGNVGKYRSIITKYFKDLYISNESIGFLGDNYDEPEEGEHVLIDSDYLEYKETCNIEKCHSSELIYKYIKEYKRGA